MGNHKPAPVRRGREVPNILRPTTNPCTDPAKSDQCPRNCYCYVNSRRTTKISTSFAKADVDILKSSSVLIGYRHVAQASVGLYYWGSGTLIGPNLIISSGHTIGHMRIHHSATFDEKNLFVLFDYEYTSSTVDSENPQINGQTIMKDVACVFEEGDDNCEDYSLLVLKSEGENLASSRIVKISSRSPLNNENIICLHHPTHNPHDPDKDTHVLFATKVSGGEVYETDNCHAFAYFKTWHGSSGGGVFDKDRCLIGVVKGRDISKPYDRHSFVKMEAILKKSSFLRQKVGNRQCVQLSDPANCNR